MDKNISFTLKVWRQKGPKAQGGFETYEMKDNITNMISRIIRIFPTKPHYF